MGMKKKKSVKKSKEIKKKKTVGGKKVNPWIAHVKQYFKDHPELTYREAMKQAKPSYFANKEKNENEAKQLNKPKKVEADEEKKDENLEENAEEKPKKEDDGDGDGDKSSETNDL